MFTIQVNLNSSQDGSNHKSNAVEKLIIDVEHDNLDAHLVNDIKALKALKDFFAIYDNVKCMKKVKKLKFVATIIDDKFLVNFKGNIRHSLLFLNQFRAISEKAYLEATTHLNNLSYKLSPQKNDITPNSVKLENIAEEKEQQSSITISTQTSQNSSARLFSHPKDNSTTSQASSSTPPSFTL